jgi:hypothetical protein
VRELETVAGDRITIPDPTRPVHLQFRRFAGCPICNLHLRAFVQRYSEIQAAGIHEVVVFHSPAEELRDYDLPFDIIADPTKKLYREYGIETSPRALLDPRVWGAIIRGILRGGNRPALRQPNGRLGLPGDFLIDPSGEVVASKRGVHANDQWSVDELLALVRV